MHGPPSQTFAVFRHRVNSMEQLAGLSPTAGIECDLRDSGGELIVTHDAFTRGPTIREFLSAGGRRPYIFNIKSEGIESAVAAEAKSAGVEDYFFLDVSIPAAVKLWRAEETRFAVRFSEFEPIELARCWSGKARWLWVDCFTQWPGTAGEWEELSKSFQLCLVSPELQGHGRQAIEAFRQAIAGRRFAAVCTKFPEAWEHAGRAE